MEHLINLNFAPGGLPATVHVSQYDDTIRQLRFQLWFGRSKVEVPSGASVRVDIKKPDGHIVLVSGTVDSSDRSIVTVPTTKQMTAVPGGSRGTLVVSSTGDKRISSAIFILQVHRDPVEDGDASDSDLSMLQDAIDQTAANATAAQAAATAAQQAAASFQTDTTLSVTGAAADAKTTGDEISAIKADLDALTEPQRLADGTDLDTVITSGVYTLYANNSYLHKPTADSEHGILEVWKEKYGDTGRTFQRLTYTYKTGRTNSEIWVRSKSGIAGAEWAPWINVSNMSINDVGNLLQSQTGIILKVEGSYINLTTDPVSLTPVVNAVWAHSVVSCAGGDAFIINADGGQMPRAWGFLDSSNHVLSVANESTIVNGLKLTAPTNAVKLIINDRSGATSYIVGNNLASSKVDVQQSPGDYGKALIINRNGQVRPGTISGGSGLTDSVRVALLACFRHVLWDDEHSVDYYNALEAALYAAESRLTAVIDYGNATVYADDPLSKVKWLMKVYYDGEEISSGDYTLTGNMNAGQNVLTITYNDESTSIIVEAEEKPASRPVLTTGDLLKFNGWGMSSAANGHKPPYLVSEETARVYYSAKGHAPYMDENNNFVEGVYPIPIPADATHVRVSVVPHDYKIALNCWRYNNKTHDYSFISGTDTGFSVWHADVDIPQYSINARALNIVIAKQDASAISSSEEPTEVVVQFT